MCAQLPKLLNSFYVSLKTFIWENFAEKVTIVNWLYCDNTNKNRFSLYWGQKFKSALIEQVVIFLIYYYFSDWRTGVHIFHTVSHSDIVFNFFPVLEVQPWKRNNRLARERHFDEEILKAGLLASELISATQKRCIRTNLSLHLRQFLHLCSQNTRGPLFANIFPKGLTLLRGLEITQIWIFEFLEVVSGLELTLKKSVEFFQTCESTHIFAKTVNFSPFKVQKSIFEKFWNLIFIISSIFQVSQVSSSYILYYLRELNLLRKRNRIKMSLDGPKMTKKQESWPCMTRCQSFVKTFLNIWFVSNEVWSSLFCNIELIICCGQEISHFGKKNTLIIHLNLESSNTAKFALSKICH